MATVTTPERASVIERQDPVTFDDIGWEGYDALLKLRAGRRYPRMVYLDGSVSLMSPATPHESLNDLLREIIRSVLVARKIPFRSFGQTTFRRKRDEAGVEGDQSYYITNLDRIRRKKTVNLLKDPPPDLAVEVVHTHGADRSLEVYRRLAVPEVWVCGAEELVFLVLGGDGQYGSRAVSSVIPGISASEVHSWLMQYDDEDEARWTSDVRQWAAEVVGPRDRAGEGS
ncbi:Uma2 family endonuclease [Aquisphaera insulae]|uniref:Uma2 family endonuclease n=1 Tax=Aquisphaera insulae TaxID=2712864 RepID=UPI0013E9EC52|nr:Uma2 family endonuclease [Aquisphaera insulae]